MMDMTRGKISRFPHWQLIIISDTQANITATGVDISYIDHTEQGPVSSLAPTDNRQSELKIGLTKTIEQNQQKLQFSQTARQTNLLFLIVKEWQAKSFKLTANQTRIFQTRLPSVFCALKNVSQQSCCWRLKVKKLSEYLLPALQLRWKRSRLINKSQTHRKTPTTWTYTNTCSDIPDSFCKNCTAEEEELPGMKGRQKKWIIWLIKIGL